MTDMTDPPDGETRSYDDLTVEQLKEVLKERSLPTSGNEAELVERLVENDAAQDGPPADPRDADSSAQGFDAGVRIESNGGDDDDDDAPLDDDVPEEFAHFVGTEADPALSDRRAEELARWRAENPEATVIPPSLLPPEFADGTIATHGLPEEQGA